MEGSVSIEVSFCVSWRDGGTVSSPAIMTVTEEGTPMVDEVGLLSVNLNDSARSPSDGAVRSTVTCFLNSPGANVTNCKSVTKSRSLRAVPSDVLMVTEDDFEMSPVRTTATVAVGTSAETVTISVSREVDVGPVRVIETGDGGVAGSNRFPSNSSNGLS